MLFGTELWKYLETSNFLSICHITDFMVFVEYAYTPGCDKMIEIIAFWNLFLLGVVHLRKQK